MMTRNLALLGAFLTLLSPALAQTKPATPQEDPEVRMGREAHEEMLKSGLKLVTDPAQLQRVEGIGKKLAEIANKTVIPALYGAENKTPYAYRFFIVDDPDINAFSLPGGFIYVNKGILKYAQSDDELAGVLGHEIMHSAHHHSARLQHEQSKLNTQMAIAALGAIFARVPINDTGNLLTGFQLVAIQKVNGYGQSAEKDADQGGIILARAGAYNPVGMLTFMERLERDQRSRPDIELGIFRTHPPEKVRAEAMIKQISALGLPINRRETSDILKVTTRLVSGLTEILVDGKVFLKMTAADRAKQTASALNKAFDQDLQVYDISAKGKAVHVRGQMLITIEPSDSVAALSQTPEKIAEDACKALRMALYRYVLNGTL